MEWNKAKIKTRTGGGKLIPLTTAGNKGFPEGGTRPSKASFSKKGGPIDSPGMKGDMGITTQKGFPKGGAPRD